MLRTLATLSLFAAAGIAQAPLTIGNLVVVRFGDGTAALTNASTPTFLDEYTTAGTLVQSIPLPTTTTGLNQPCTNSGTSTSEGFLNLSENGLFLTLAGYTAAPGLAAVPTTTASATPRVVARIDLNGVIDTSTTITDGYNGATGSNGNIRSAVSADGFGFWTAGTGASNAGVRYLTLGSSTTVAINAGAPQNTRVIGLYNGQLFTTSASTVYQSVCAVGSGLPTTGPQSVNVLNGLPTATGPSAYDYWFSDPQTLYIADDRTPALVPTNGGGIFKYELVAGTWTLAYVLQPTAGCRGLTGRRVNGVTTLYATTSSGQVVSVVDSGVGATFNTLASAPTNTAFRGLRFLPKPTTLQRLPAGCGSANLVCTGTAEIGTDVITTVQNPLGLPLIIYGFPTFLPLPGCGCTLLSDLTLIVTGPQFTLSIPNNPALFSFALRTQGLDLLAPAQCAAPFDIGVLTDAYAITIQ